MDPTAGRLADVAGRELPGMEVAVYGPGAIPDVEVGVVALAGDAVAAALAAAACDFFK
jgi:hypothetical protein